ncbi:MAG TPA: PP2C family protein-serine/threonine phosphatase [Cyclobacteriaceae bacterium]|nr:PP2C family protein-serine/threonine phosphatase [Cyclobacteriaceae bacterium]
MMAAKTPTTADHINAPMNQADWKFRYDLKELELNALLEITRAINNNLPEESIYRIYNFIIRANLNLQKLALYVKDEHWECKVNFGTVNDFAAIPIDDRFLKISHVRNIHIADSDNPFSEFEKVFPVAHKNNLLAVVFMGGFGSRQPEIGEINTDFIQTLSNFILVAIENKKLARKELEQESLRKELEIARNVQKQLFPKELPCNDKICVYASYFPHQVVGGDYYDYIEIDENRFMITIADVSGKGIPASLLMSNFQASLRALARQTGKLEKIIRELNQITLQNNNGENFITFFAAIYNRKQGYLKYVNAGHNPPLLNSPVTGIITLESGTTVLGILHPLPFLNIGKIRDVAEFTFLSFTDGLTETFNKKDEQFGSERVKNIFEQNNDQSLRDIHSAMIDEVSSFRGNTDFDDDITLFSCRVKKNK